MVFVCNVVYFFKKNMLTWLQTWRNFVLAVFFSDKLECIFYFCLQGTQNLVTRKQ